MTGLLVADYDSDRSPRIQKDRNGIEQLMSKIFKKCYNFVTPMRQRDLEPSSNHDQALDLLNWLTKDINIKSYRSYLRDTIGKGKSVSAFLSSLEGLPNVFDTVATNFYMTIILVGFYFVFKYLSMANEMISEQVQWIRHFKFSVLIPAAATYCLLSNCITFYNTCGEAEEHLRYSLTWHRDFLKHHTTWIDKKTNQFQCIANEYWVGMYKFKYMSGPFFVYRDVLMKTEGVFGNYSLEQFLQKYQNQTAPIDVKSDPVFFTTYEMMDSIHMKINQSQPWGPDHQVHEFRDMFTDYYERVLQIPDQNAFFVMRMMILFIVIYNFILIFEIAYAPFMEVIVVKKWIVRVLDWGQNALPIFMIIEAAMFAYLMTQVAGAFAVQKAILDVNMAYLTGVNSRHGLDLGKTFGEMHRVNKTLIEILFKEEFIFEARPELFEMKVNQTDFAFLDRLFPIENMTSQIGINQTASSLINVHNLYKGIAEELGMETREEHTFFTGIIFGINYNRFAISLMKHIIITASTPMWSLTNLPYIHFVIGIWIVFALPIIKATMETQYLIHEY